MIEQQSHSKILEKVLIKIPKVFDLIIKNNQNKLVKTSFDSRSSLAFNDYFSRIIELVKPELSTLICCFIYIDKLCQKDKFVISTNNLNKLFFISLYISIKFNEDVIFAINDFGVISALKIEEINKLEKKFLDLLNYDLLISYKDYETYKSYLI